MRFLVLGAGAPGGYSVYWQLPPPNHDAISGDALAAIIPIKKQPAPTRPSGSPPAMAFFNCSLTQLVAVTASCAIIYWAAGWGLYRGLTQDSDLRRATQKFAEVSDKSVALHDASVRGWKLALSIAVVAAVAVPAFAGTWRLAPGKWVDLTASQKERLSRFMEQTNNCTSSTSESEYEGVWCWIARDQLSDGGVWYPPERVTPKYLAINFFTSAGAFVLTFAFVMIGPSIGRLYLAWLRR